MRGGLGLATARVLRAAPVAPRAYYVPVPALIRWTFYLFVFSIPFEAPAHALPMETTTMTGALFLLAALTQPQRFFRWPPRAVWAFLAYCGVFWIAVAAGGGQYLPEAAKSFAFVLQGILICWAAYHVLQDPRVTNVALVILGVACVILAFMTLFGIMTRLSVDEDVVRLTVLGQNPNRAARILMSGLLALVGVTYGRDRPLIQPRFLIWPLVAVIGLAIIEGGSRGGLLALMIGLAVFMFAGTSLTTKVRNVLVGMFALTALVFVVLASPLMQRRIALAEQGNLAKREEIWPAALGMVVARPWIGWGAENLYELARRLPQEHRTTRDTHNLVLHVLTSAGLIGALPYFAGILLVLGAAWTGRHGALGMLPFALLLALMAGNMSANNIALKVQWLALALALASVHLRERR